MKKEKEKMNIKEIIQNAKNKGKIKPLKEAFKKYPVEQEKHRGDANYFLN